LLRAAEQRRAGPEATSTRLTDTQTANELRITELNNQLRAKATALGLAELFGLARQAANDNSSILQQSLITTQFPPPPGELARDEPGADVGETARRVRHDQPDRPRGIRLRMAGYRCQCQRSGNERDEE